MADAEADASSEGSSTSSAEEGSTDAESSGSSTGEAEPGCNTRLLYDPAFGHLQAFPDDFFTQETPDGTRVDLSGVTLEGAYADFPTLFEAAGTLDGFGTSAGIFVRFDGALDEDTVGDALVLLEQGDEVRSIEFGWRLVAEHEDDPSATLLVEPLAALQPGTRYGLALTDDVTDADGGCVGTPPAMAALLDGSTDVSLSSRYAALISNLVDEDVIASADDLVGAIVFTTGFPTLESRQIADAIELEVPPQIEVDECTVGSQLSRCDGVVRVADFTDEAGVVAQDGQPQGYYDLPITSYTWPGIESHSAILFAHGLGGTRHSAEFLAAAYGPGFVIVAIDAPKHGDHPDAASFIDAVDFFGLDLAGTDRLRPLEGRDNLRQATFDKLQVLQALHDNPDVNGDGVSDFDGDVHYLGVSLGGVMGPEFLALAPDIDQAALVVPGARLSTLIGESSTFSVYVDQLLGAATEGERARLLVITQSVVDRGEPFAWAPYAFDQGADVLVQMVVDDDIMPNSATAALARGLGAPLVGPELAALIGVAHEPELPVSGNITRDLTAGVFQFDTDAAGDPATHGQLVYDWRSILQASLFMLTGEISDPTDV